MTRGEILLLLLVGACVALAAGCANQEVRVPERVAVAVAVPCIDPEKRPRPPLFRSEQDLLNMDRYRRTLASWSDLKKHEAYLAELEAIVEACSRIPSSR